MNPLRFLIPSRLVGTLALLLGVLLVAGCSHAPGMYLDRNDAQFRARVDLVPVNHALLSQWADEARRQAEARGRQLAADGAGAQQPYMYRIAPQDVLRITVWNQPELTNPAGTTTELSGRVVNADGSLYFPFVGNLQVAGKTVVEVREMITAGLSRVIRSPQVDVSILQYRGLRVYVAGEVRAPGSQAINDVPPDVTEMLARAGGLTAEADLQGATVTRGAQVLNLDLQALYYEGQQRENLRLVNGDVLYVPERRASRVFMTGELIRPTSLPMPRGRLSLADALSEAGGLNPISANAGQVFVIRGETERPRVFHLNAASPEALLLADRFDLKPRDVVYVDVAPVVRWSRLVSNILPSASLLRESVSEIRR